MAVTEEGWHTTDDGQKLYTKTWKVMSNTIIESKHMLTLYQTDGPAKARIVFVHGFSDHCNIAPPFESRTPANACSGNTYDNLFPALASNGIEVYAFDQR